MTTTNPLLKATRAAFTELTTPEAQAWYRAQAQATAAGAMAIAHRSIVAVRHLLKPKQDLLPGGEVAKVIVAAAVVKAETSSIPFGWAAIEANDVAVVPVQDEDNTELLPTDESEDKAITVASVDGEDEPSAEDSEDEGEEPETDEEKEG